MPIYTYDCPQHGEFEQIERMNGRRATICPQCLRPAKKLMLLFGYDKKSKMGHTRMELFDNLAKEGNGHKDWRDTDTYYQQAIGVPTEERNW